MVERYHRLRPKKAHGSARGRAASAAILNVLGRPGLILALALASSPLGRGTPADAVAAQLERGFDFRFWTRDQGLPDNEVRDLLAASSGYLWIATREGLARFDGLRFVVYATANVPEMRSNDCRVLAEDASGGVCVGTGDGLLRFDRNVTRLDPRAGVSP